MSVIATPVKQTEAVRAADAVYLVDIATGLPAGGGGGGGGTVDQGAGGASAWLVSGPLTDTQLRATPIATNSVVYGQNGTAAASQTNPIPVAEAQGVIASGPGFLTANTPVTIIGAFADRRKFRILNWIQAPVYVSYGTTGTPVSGAGSDFIPAAQVINGVLTPSQYEPWIVPVGGMRAVCAVTGELTVVAA